MLSSLIGVVVIDDHLVTREGIVALLSNNPNLEVVGIGSAGEHVLSLLRDHEPDVLLVDLQMPLYADNPQAGLFEPISALETAIEQWPQTAVVVISQEQDIYTISSLAEIGVKGYFLKSDQLTSTLGSVVEQINAGGTYFSPGVREIIEGVPKLRRQAQLTQAQLQTLRVLLRHPEARRSEQADSLHITPSAFQKRINSLFKALDVPNIESCLLKAMRMDLGNGVAEDHDAVDQTTPISKMEMTAATPRCNSCGSPDIVKNGLTGSGKQKYSCKACGGYGTLLDD